MSIQCEEWREKENYLLDAINKEGTICLSFSGPTVIFS